MGAVGVLVIGIGVAAATPGSGGTITACYSRSSGALRVIENSGEHCKWYESKLVWSRGSAALQNGSVVGGPGGVVADNTLTKDDLAPNSVMSSELANGSVDTGALGDDAVTAAKILNGEVGTDDLAGDAVTSGKILDGEVGTDDLAGDAVTAAKILNGEIGTDELAGDAVTSGKIKDGEVGTDDLAGNAVTAAKILNGEIGTDELAGDAVTTGKIKNGEVGTDDLGDGSVTSEKITANAGDALAGSNSLVTAGTPITVASANVNTGANHTLMVVGQTQLDCVCVGVDDVTITWQVFEGASAVSKEFHTRLSGAAPAAAAPISALIGDSGTAGTHTYDLRVTRQNLGTSTATVSSISFSVVDLGR